MGNRRLTPAFPEESGGFKDEMPENSPSDQSRDADAMNHQLNRTNWPPVAETMQGRGPCVRSAETPQLHRLNCDQSELQNFESSLIKGGFRDAVVLGSKRASVAIGLSKHSSPDVKTMERRIRHLQIPPVLAVDQRTVKLANTPLQFTWHGRETREKFGWKSDQPPRGNSQKQ